MKKYDFKEAVEFTDEFSIKIDHKEYEGFFCNIRVDRNTVPEGWYAYDLRHDDDTWSNIIEIKNGQIVVNFFGSFLTKDELPLKENEYLYDDQFTYCFR